MTRKKKTAAEGGEIDLEGAIERLVSKNPSFAIALVLGAVGLYAIIQKPGTRPAWLKDLPPLGGRRAGPWRGKGSFGKGFGPQTRHRS